jgi:hypothetical protein
VTPDEALRHAWASAWRAIAHTALRPLASASKVDALCQSWEFVAGAALHLSVAHRFQAAAKGTDEALRRVRAIAGAMASPQGPRAATARSDFERAFGLSLQRGSLGAGRRNETDLRDLVVTLIANAYPRAGRRAVARRVACELAALCWPQLHYSEDLVRDMRRRRQGRRGASRAYIAFRSDFESVYRIAFAQAVESAPGAMSGLLSLRG